MSGFLAPQKNVDEAVEGLRAKGITVVGAVCHVSNAEQRKHLVDTAVKVRFRLPIHSSVVAVEGRGDSVRQCWGSWVTLLSDSLLRRCDFK